jgi:hypothetical protein
MGIPKEFPRTRPTLAFVDANWANIEIWKKYLDLDEWGSGGTAVCCSETHSS